MRLADPRLILRAALTLALIAFLLWRIDLEQAAVALRDARYLYVIPGLALFGIAKLLVAQRWRMMMSEFGSPPLGPMFGVLLVSNLANNILPMRLGDLIRVQVPAQRYGTSRARLAATVFATESLLDGVAFAVIALIGLALIDLQGFPTGVFWGLLGLVVGGLIAVVPLSHLRLNDGWHCRGLLARLPDDGQRFLETSVPHFIDGLAVFRSLRLAVPALALSFAIWMLEVAMFVLFGRAFDITLALPAWMLIMVSANVISSLPITPSNIGAYELAITELTKALGVDPGAAAAFAIATHMFNILWITVAGIIAMLALRLTVADVFSLRTPESTATDAKEPAPAPG